MKRLSKLLVNLGLRKKVIFIVEDNPVYAKTLQSFIHTRFPEIRIHHFPVGETCIQELDEKPFIIIMDYFLDTSFSDAATGLSTIKRIKEIAPKTKIILLSSEVNLDLVMKAHTIASCQFVLKDDRAFNIVERIVAEALHS
jgi:DNA-binding NarL/FixJ family response regulator